MQRAVKTIFDGKPIETEGNSMRTAKWATSVAKDLAEIEA